MARQSALIVEVPAAEDAVRELRLAHTHDAPLGVPAHLTILFPFLDPDAIDALALQAVLEPHAPFAFVLAQTARFPGIVYLRPDPAKPFAELTRAVWSRWPERPPYGGVHDELVPHLTVAEGDDRTLAAAEAEVAPRLPIAARVTALTLIEQVEPGGRWRTRRRFGLSG